MLQRLSPPFSVLASLQKDRLGRSFSQKSGGGAQIAFLKSAVMECAGLNRIERGQYALP